MCSSPKLCALVVGCLCLIGLPTVSFGASFTRPVSEVPPSSSAVMTHPAIEAVVTPILSTLHSAPGTVCVSGACLQVGPRIASVDSERGFLINLLVEQLLDSSVSLDVLDWNAIAQAEVSLLDFLSVLQTQTGASTTEEVLASNVDLIDIVNATAVAAEADGDLATALTNLVNVLTVGGLDGSTIQLDDLLVVDFPIGSLTDIDVNLFSLLFGSIQLYNYQNVTTTGQAPITLAPADLTLLGLGGLFDGVTGALNLRVQVVEPPVITCGPVGTMAHTSAIRLELDLDNLINLTDSGVVDLGLTGLADVDITVANLTLYVEVARADAEITAIDPIANTVDVDATPSIADVFLGVIDETLFFNRSRTVGSINFATEVTPATIGSLEIDGPLGIGDAAGDLQARSWATDLTTTTGLHFTGAYPETQTAISSADYVTDIVTDLVNNLEVSASGTGLLTVIGLIDAIIGDLLSDVVAPLVNNVIAPPLADVLTDLVDPLLQTLGIHIGEAEVTVFDVGLSSLDCDCDGIPNAAEGLASGRDADGDGVLDYLDLDSDNDGIYDVSEAGGADTNTDGIIDDANDTDGDGIPDSVDIDQAGGTDTDGDGIIDTADTTQNPGENDRDGDGIIDTFDPDADGNGLADSVDEAEGGTALPNGDADSDGLANAIDIDADGDGIPDLIEGQPSMGSLIIPTAANSGDTDGDGIIDAFDADQGGATYAPENTDGTDNPDYLDDDSDNDGAPDIVEGHDMNEDGSINNAERAPTGGDADGDGLDDGFEGEFGAVYLLGDFQNAANGIGTPPADLPNRESDGDMNEPDYRDTGVVLPVELVSFEAVRHGSDVHLRWKTASETNNAGFEVQGREGGSGEWEAIGWVDGQGTTSIPQAYRYEALALDPGTHTFRLKQVDFDGSLSLSPEVNVEVEMVETHVIEPIYPNPFNPHATLRFAVQQAQPIQVELFNMLGQRVQTLLNTQADAGQMHTVAIDGRNLASGLYIVRITGARFVETQTVTLLK